MDVQQFLDNFAYLANEPKGITYLRDMILKLAIQGRITIQLPDEDVFTFLKELNKRKEGLLKEVGLRKKKIIHLDYEPLKTIPSNWAWVRLDDITEDVHLAEKWRRRNSGKPQN